MANQDNAIISGLNSFYEKEDEKGSIKRALQTCFDFLDLLQQNGSVNMISAEKFLEFSKIVDNNVDRKIKLNTSVIYGLWVICKKRDNAPFAIAPLNGEELYRIIMHNDFAFHVMSSGKVGVDILPSVEMSKICEWIFQRMEKRKQQRELYEKENKLLPAPDFLHTAKKGSRNASTKHEKQMGKK